MLEIHARTEQPGRVMASDALRLTLIFQDRQRSRLRVSLSNGQQAALLLPRGSVLRGGDTLALSDGRTVWVVAAPELVSTVRAESAEALARAAYHLGNRHVPLQVGAGFLRYLRDHVLDAMVSELGLTVVSEQAPFEPESGAYGKHTHAPGHHHGHAHADSHAHSDESEQGHGHGHVLGQGSGVKRALGLVEVADDESGTARESSDVR